MAHTHRTVQSRDFTNLFETTKRAHKQSEHNVITVLWMMKADMSHSTFSVITMHIMYRKGQNRRFRSIVKQGHFTITVPYSQTCRKWVFHKQHPKNETSTETFVTQCYNSALTVMSWNVGYPNFTYPNVHTMYTIGQNRMLKRTVKQGRFTITLQNRQNSPKSVSHKQQCQCQ